MAALERHAREEVTHETIDDVYMASALEEYRRKAERKLRELTITEEDTVFAKGLTAHSNTTRLDSITNTEASSSIRQQEGVCDIAKTVQAMKGISAAEDSTTGDSITNRRLDNNEGELLRQELTEIQAMIRKRKEDTVMKVHMSRTVLSTREANQESEKYKQYYDKWDEIRQTHCLREAKVTRSLYLREAKVMFKLLEDWPNREDCWSTGFIDDVTKTTPCNTCITVETMEDMEPDICFERLLVSEVGILNQRKARKQAKRKLCVLKQLLSRHAKREVAKHNANALKQSISKQVRLEEREQAKLQVYTERQSKQAAVDNVYQEDRFYCKWPLMRRVWRVNEYDAYVKGPITNTKSLLADGRVSWKIEDREQLSVRKGYEECYIEDGTETIMGRKATDKLQFQSVEDRCRLKAWSKRTRQYLMDIVEKRTGSSWKSKQTNDSVGTRWRHLWGEKFVPVKDFTFIMSNKETEHFGDSEIWQIEVDPSLILTYMEADGTWSRRVLINAHVNKPTTFAVPVEKEFTSGSINDQVTTKPALNEEVVSTHQYKWPVREGTEAISLELVILPFSTVLECTQLVKYTTDVYGDKWYEMNENIDIMLLRNSCGDLKRAEAELTNYTNIRSVKLEALSIFTTEKKVVLKESMDAVSEEESKLTDKASKRTDGRLGLCSDIEDEDCRQEGVFTEADLDQLWAELTTKAWTEREGVTKALLADKREAKAIHYKANMKPGVQTELARVKAEFSYTRQDILLDIMEFYSAIVANQEAVEKATKDLSEAEENFKSRLRVYQAESNQCPKVIAAVKKAKFQVATAVGKDELQEAYRQLEMALATMGESGSHSQSSKSTKEERKLDLKLAYRKAQLVNGANRRINSSIISSSEKKTMAKMKRGTTSVEDRKFHDKCFKLHSMSDKSVQVEQQYYLVREKDKGYATWRSVGDIYEPEVRWQPEEVIYANMFSTSYERDQEEHYDHLRHLNKVIQDTCRIMKVVEDSYPLVTVNFTRQSYDEEPTDDGGMTSLNPNKNLTFWETEVRGRRRNVIAGSVEDITLLVPINGDGGASLNIVSQEVADYLKAKIELSKNPIRVKAVNGGITVCRHECTLFLDFKGKDAADQHAVARLGTRFTIMPGCSTPLLIGSNTFAWFDINPRVKDQVTEFKGSENCREQGSVFVPHMDVNDAEDTLSRPIHEMDMKNRLLELSPEQLISYRAARDIRRTNVQLENMTKRCEDELRELLKALDGDEAPANSNTPLMDEEIIGDTMRTGTEQNSLYKATTTVVPIITAEESEVKLKSLWGSMISTMGRYMKLQTVNDQVKKVNAAKQEVMTEERAREIEKERIECSKQSIKENTTIIDEWNKNHKDIKQVTEAMDSLDTWEEDLGDDITDLKEEYTLNEDETDKPALFPSELWKFVKDSQKPLVKARWARYEDEGLLKEHVEDLLTIDICKERPKTFPYIMAQVMANLSRYYQVDENNPELVPNVFFRINTTTNVPVMNKRAPRWANLERCFMGVKQSEMLKHKQLEKSESPYRSPPMLVAYNDRIKEFMTEFAANPQDALDVTKNPQNRKRIAAFFRFTMDMTMINDITIADNHPMPNSMDCLESMAGARSFSAQDMADGFWNMALHPDDRHKTAFATHNMLLQWTVCVQGAKNAAVAFARMIQNVFNEAPRNITVFQDDVFNHAKGVKELMEMHQISFDRMEENCLFFKRSKARLNYPRIKCLGHIITKDGRSPDPSKIKAILNLRQPTCPGEVRSMMGIVNFNHEYIAQLADILAPLNDIAHDDADVVKDWKDEVHGEALRKLKQVFTTSPVLALPDMSRRFRIWVDTCTTKGRGVGGVLSQWYGEGEPDLKDLSGKGWRTVAYHSKLLNKSQRRYGVTEAEAMGMHDCIMRWAPYLQTGEFDVIVDHKALTYIYNSPATTANRRILKYALNLQKFTFTVIYKDGSKHLNADAMSRLYQYGDDVDDDDEQEASNFDVVTQEDIDLLTVKVKLDTIGLTNTSALIKDTATIATVLRRATRLKKVPKTTMAYRMSQDADYMMLGDGGVLQDTMQYTGRADFYEDEKGNVTNVRSLKHDDDTFDDYQEVHYVNINWQRDDGNETDGDEPSHMMIVDKITGEVEYRPLQSIYSRCMDCNVRANSMEGYGTRSKTGTAIKGKVLHDDDALIPKLNIRARINKAATRKLKEREADIAKAIFEAKCKQERDDKEELKQLKLQAIKEAREQTKVDKEEDKLLRLEVKAKEKAKQVALRKEIEELEVQRKLAKSELLLQERKRLRLEEISNKLIERAQREGDKRQERLKVKLANEEFRRQKKQQQMQARQEELKDSGPRKIIIDGVLNTINETEAMQLEREAGEDKAVAIGLKIIGGLFEHPKTKRLYEVMYVFYDPVSKLIVANRKPADMEPSTSEDAYAYEVEGDNGIEVLVEAFATTAGFNLEQAWPKCEADMRAAQMKDLKCADLISRYERGEGDLRIRGKEICTHPLTNGERSALRIQVDSDTGVTSLFGDEFVTVVPAELCNYVMKYFHEGLAHPGKIRVIKSVRTKYYWEGMDRDIDNYVGNCRLCKLRKSTQGQGKLPLQRYTVGVRPMQRVHVDLVGPLQKTVGGYEYILVAKCAFSQWIEVVALHGKSAREVTAAIVDHVLSVHGSVEHFVTDNGKEFVANLAEAVHELISNVHTTTTPYNPQANGKVENQNKTLKDMLAMYVHANQRNWDIYLPVIVHAYRTTVNVATGYSPFRIIFGREARQATEAWIEDFARKDKVNINEYVNELTAALLYTWRSVGERTLKNQQSVDYQSLVHKREKIFKPYTKEDKFYLRTIPKRFHSEKGRDKQKITAKLQFRYTGPHTVIEVINPVTYIAMVNGRRKTVHALKMKRETSTAEKFVGFEDDIFDESDGDSDSDNGNAVEKTQVKDINHGDINDNDIDEVQNSGLDVIIEERENDTLYNDSDSEASDEDTGHVNKDYSDRVSDFRGGSSNIFTSVRRSNVDVDYD